MRAFYGKGTILLAKEVREFIRSNPGLTSTEINAAMGKTGLTSIINHLVKQGGLVPERVDGKTTYRTAVNPAREARPSPETKLLPEHIITTGKRTKFLGIETE